MGHVAHIREQRHASRVLVGKPEEKIPLGIPRYRWEENINMDIKEVATRKWTSLMWLTESTSGGLLWTWSWDFGFHKMGISWLAENMSASQEGLTPGSWVLRSQETMLNCWGSIAVQTVGAVNHSPVTSNCLTRFWRTLLHCWQSLADEDWEWIHYIISKGGKSNHEFCCFKYSVLSMNSNRQPSKQASKQTVVMLPNTN